MKVSRLKVTIRRVYMSKPTGEVLHALGACPQHLDIWINGKEAVPWLLALRYEAGCLC